VVGTDVQVAHVSNSVFLGPGEEESNRPAALLGDQHDVFLDCEPNVFGNLLPALPLVLRLGVLAVKRLPQLPQGREIGGH
jgi:hypothetical protein